MTEPLNNGLRDLIDGIGKDKSLDDIIRRHLEEIDEILKSSKLDNSGLEELLEEIKPLEPVKKKVSSTPTDEAFDKIKELNDKMPESAKQKFKEAMQGKTKEKQAAPDWDAIEALEAETLRKLNEKKQPKAPEIVEPKGLTFGKTPSFDQVSQKSAVSLTDVKPNTGLFGTKS